MHICFLTNEFPKEGFPHGGIGSFVRTLAVAFVKQGVKVSVVGMNYTENDENETIDGVTIYRLQKSKVKGLAWYYNSKAINEKIKNIHNLDLIDIVEASELGLAFINKIKNIKYIIRLHGGHHFFAESENRGIDKWKGFQEKRSFEKAAAFIAVSNYVKSHTAKFLSYHNKPIEVIFNPINSQLFQPLETAIEVSNITFAGTICEKKGVRQLIQSFPMVKEKFPNVILNLYGRDWLFPDGSSYIKMLQEIELPKIGNISKDIIFHGAVSYNEIPSAYAKAAVCVFPSHMETLGLVAPEAMVMEKPVIFTKLGPGPEVIADGETGWLCNPHEPKEIANTIIQVLSNPHKASEIAKQGRLSVLQQFEIKTIVSKNIEFYNKLVV